jgi:hypothetical protein
MMAVWVVVGVLGMGAAAAAYASRRHSDDVEPSVREFTEFRNAISRQVAGVQTDTRATRRHLDRQPAAAQPAGRPSPPVDQRAEDQQTRG